MTPQKTTIDVVPTLTTITRAPRPGATTCGYSRLWKALIAGAVPPRDEDVTTWYAASRHVIGLCLHEAHLEQLLGDTGMPSAALEAQEAAA